LRDPYHYLRLRAGALKLRLTEWAAGEGSDGGLPVPPPMLRQRVHGRFDRESYLNVGRQCARDIRDLLGRAGRDFDSFGEVLDFGCGSGRVLRFLRDRPESCRLHGTDIDEQAIAWCRKHLPFASWSANAPMPRTAYPDRTFDLIYAISVFTHIDEEMQFAWLAELGRIAKPGAVLLLTVHGEHTRSEFPEHDKALVAQNGFMYTVLKTGRFKPDGLPDFYQVTHHTRAYIEDRWSAYFDLAGYVERGLNAHQDAVILLNRQPGPDAGTGGNK